MTDLMPCPLCGSRHAYSEMHKLNYIRQENDPAAPGIVWLWRVVCGDCCCMTGNYTTEEAAIKRWNSRPETREVKAAAFMELAKELDEFMRRKEAEGE